MIGNVPINGVQACCAGTRVFFERKIQAEFTGNLLPLVYGGGTPAFEQAFGDFNTVAEALLEALP